MAAGLATAPLRQYLYVVHIYKHIPVRTSCHKLTQTNNIQHLTVFEQPNILYKYLQMLDNLSAGMIWIYCTKPYTVNLWKPVLQLDINMLFLKVLLATSDIYFLLNFHYKLICISRAENTIKYKNNTNELQSNLSVLWLTFDHNLQLLGDLGKGMTSLMFETPSKYCRNRSKPIPNPPWGAVPNLRKSRYLKTVQIMITDQAVFTDS